MATEGNESYLPLPRIRRCNQSGRWEVPLGAYQVPVSDCILILSNERKRNFLQVYKAKPAPIMTIRVNSDAALVVSWCPELFKKSILL